MKFSLTSGKFGLLGAFLAVLSLVIIITLGFFQPGYNHFTNTISALVAGEMGWIQTLNFFVLSLAFVFTGYGLGKSLTNRNYNSIFAIFILFASFTTLVAFIPTDMVNSQETFRFSQLSPYGRIHYFFVLAIILIIPLILSNILNKMRKSLAWKTLVPFTQSILVFNFLVGLLWYGFVSLGYLNEWKGLIQKVLATNVIVWIAIIGYKTWVLEENARRESK